MKRKWVVTAVIVLAAAAIVVYSMSRHQTNKVHVRTFVVQPRAVQSSILASGSFEYKNRTELRSQISGQIISLPVREGSRVKEGQIVLRINPQTYQANVEQQQANVDLQRYAIREAKLKLQNIKLQWNRKRHLYNQGLLDANTYDQLTNEYQLAKVAVHSAGQSLSEAKAQLSYAKEQLAKTVIRAPIAGIITSLNVKLGESVIPGTTNIPGSTLMTIGNPSEILAKVDVDQADVANVAKGQPASVQAISFPGDNLKGAVSFISAASEAVTGKKASSTDQGQGFEVKIRIHQKKKLDIKPGMNCRAEIFTQTSKNTLAVPIQAVLFTHRHPSTKARQQSHNQQIVNQAGAYVFIDRHGIARKHTVTLGISSDNWQAIVKGLKKGEKIITGPYTALHSLSDGSAITSISASLEHSHTHG